MAENSSTKLQDKIYFYKTVGNQVEEIIIDIIPQEVTYTYTPNFQEQSTLGRLSPLYSYINGSDKKIAFSVKLHEDLGSIRESYETLDGLVSKLKSLSYPSTTGGALEDVSFHLGEITGKGIVNTSVSWEKPFRDGRYLVANISFDITVTKEYTPVSSTEITERVELPNGVYQEVPKLLYTTDMRDSLKHFIMDSTGSKYNTAYNHLLDSTDSKEVREYYLAQAKKSFDYNATILTNLYDMIALRGDEKKINSYINSHLTIGEYLYEYSYLVNNMYIKKTNESSAKKDLNSLRSAFKKYIEDEYKNNKDITLEEKDSMITDIDQFFDSLIKSLEGVIKYGANS
jgi:hypothetical protein